jgi:hypothetical protein
VLKFLMCFDDDKPVQEFSCVMMILKALARSHHGGGQWTEYSTCGTCGYQQS